jgi:ribosomal protein L16 Arg81 hydroxylase
VAGIADPARVAALFEDGATIVLQGLHRWAEPVTRFVRDLELDLGHPCQVNAYITPPGARGLALHDDPHDVLVLQAFGRKSWQIHAAPSEGDRVPIDAQIGPGDTIYMPTGTPHAASAQESVSGHLTVGIHVVGWREVLTGIWSRLAEDDPAAEGSVPARWTGDPEAFGRELGARLERMAGALRDADPSTEAERRLDRFISTRAQLARGTVAGRAEPVAADDLTVLRRRPGSICELRRRDGVLVVLLGDRWLEMPLWLEPAMRRLAQADELVVGDLRAELPDAESRAVLARRLIREGLVVAARTRPADDR